MRKPVIVKPGRVTLRHVRKDAGGSVEVLGTAMSASSSGLNGAQGWANGEFALRVSEDGDFRITFPNVESAGQLHSDRFLVTADKDNYAVGDEWFEIWSGPDLEFVGTPQKATLSGTRIDIVGFDPCAIARTQRDTAAAFHLAGPLDIFAHSCSAQTVAIAEDFADGAPAMSYSSSPQPTSDGRFTYRRAESSGSGAWIHDPSTPGATSGEIETTETVTTGIGSEPWRVEATITDFLNVATFASLRVGDDTELHLGGLVVDFATTGAGSIRSTTKDTDRGIARLAIEGRGRWLFAYVNDRLIGVLPEKQGATLNASTITLSVGAPGSASGARMRSLLARQFAPFLRPTLIDRRLAGAPVPTGLSARYFSVAGVLANGAAGAERAISPVAAPVASRVELGITHPPAAPPTWQPLAAGAKNFAVRWTGAIYLPLASSDVRVRAKHTDGARVWVGKTKFPDTYITNWGLGSGLTDTGASLRTHLGQSDDGWYPIILEWFAMPDGGGGASPQIEIEYDLNASGSWAAIGDTTVKLSPYGIVEQHSRLDSLYELRRQVAETFGYQYRFRPRSLESGAFPGVLEVGARVGRDTEKVLSSIDEATEAQQEIDATDSAEILLVDAAGLADPDQGSTLTYEAMDVGALGGHVFLHTVAEQASDITDRALLEQRATSLAALHASPFTLVQTRPVAANEIIRNATWSAGLPVLGDLALFKWEPGDGMRVQLPEIGVDDRTPRQIMGVSWPIFPKGVGAPTVAFRQRPRRLRDFMYRMLRRQAAQAGHFQGQQTQLTGSLGSTDATRSPDGYSRLVLPPSVEQVIHVDLVVIEKGDSSEKTVEVNGAGVGTVKTVGPVDVTGYAQITVAGQRLMVARLTGGSSSHTFQLVATVAV